MEQTMHSREQKLTLDMNTGITNYFYETAKNFEGVYTGGGNDTITGTAGNNIIVTGAGDDTLIGGDGNDLLKGMSGNDTLNGGSGDDNLTGGLGKDVMSDLSGWNHYNYFATNESTVGANRDIIVQVEINGDGNMAADMEIQLSGIAGQILSAIDFNL